MKSVSSGEMVSINPANGAKVGSVSATSITQLDDAVANAWAAYEHSGWRDLRPDKRAAVLHNVASRLISEKERLATLQMLDNGKPIVECRGMVDAAADAFRYYASVCETLETEVTSPRGDYVSLTVLEPYGVVAAITPWNSPVQIEAQKVAPALAAGNAVLLKPSEDTPLLAPELMRICLEAGLPKNQLQIVQGVGEEIGAALVAHRGVRMVSFTGGTATGRHIAKTCGERICPVALELGGKSPHIVFADADIEHAVAAVASGIFGSSGQSCIAGSRLLVQEEIYADFLARIVNRAKTVRVGTPDTPDIEMGPLASFHHRDRVAAYVDIARSEGGRILCGGQQPDEAVFASGAYYLPTVIDKLAPDARAVQEEIFGPVLVVLPFKDEADLVAQANGTAFGLACGIWSQDFKRAWRIARRIEAGSVWINTYKQSIITTPFGGFKNSGIERERGPQGLRIYTQIKSIFLGMHDSPLSIAKYRVANTH